MSESDIDMIVKQIPSNGMSPMSDGENVNIFRGIDSWLTTTSDQMCIDKDEDQSWAFIREFATTDHDDQSQASVQFLGEFAPVEGNQVGENLVCTFSEASTIIAPSSQVADDISSYGEFRKHFFKYYDRASTPFMCDNQLGEVTLERTASMEEVAILEEIQHQMDNASQSSWSRDDAGRLVHQNKDCSICSDIEIGSKDTSSTEEDSCDYSWEMNTEWKKYFL
uniref:Uncharacterized protein n=1 Tax=Trichogramma kaykai TaxID=54128 RepID=A0ABD2W7G0_9HYME